MYSNRPIVLLPAALLAMSLVSATAQAQPTRIDDDDVLDEMIDDATVTSETTTTAGTTTARPAPVMADPSKARTVEIPVGADVEVVRRYSILPNTPMMMTGLVVFAIPYVASTGVAASSERESDKYLFTPVAGPWLALANRDCETRACSFDEDSNRVLLVADGILQGVGALLLLGGLFIPERIEETRAPVSNVRVAPMSVRAGAGVGVTGVLF